MTVIICISLLMLATLILPISIVCSVLVGMGVTISVYLFYVIWLLDKSREGYEDNDQF